MGANAADGEAGEAGEANGGVFGGVYAACTGEGGGAGKAGEANGGVFGGVYTAGEGAAGTGFWISSVISTWFDSNVVPATENAKRDISYFCRSTNLFYS